jgi:hypothetical protein
MILVLLLLGILAVIVFGALAAFIGEIFLVGLAIGLIVAVAVGVLRLRPRRD